MFHASELCTSTPSADRCIIRQSASKKRPIKKGIAQFHQLRSSRLSRTKSFVPAAHDLSEPQTGPFYSFERREVSGRFVSISPESRKSLPLRALLVQDAVSTVFASDRIATLQGHLRRALATEVHDRGTVNGHGAKSTLIAAAHRGDLVCFARHG